MRHGLAPNCLALNRLAPDRFHDMIEPKIDLNARGNV